MRPKILCTRHNTFVHRPVVLNDNCKDYNKPHHAADEH